ncbi:glycosyltransferase family 4 protein [Candidatus Parcubacteria bacterium]|nr:glycosyltransferase family 4 protein [Candidatus Parcubacteria bacterium]
MSMYIYGIILAHNKGKNNLKMKVLILSTAYLPEIGGSELAIKNITDRIDDISFDLITSRPLDTLPYEKIGNVNVYRVGNKASLFNLLLPKNFLSLWVFFKARQLIQTSGSYDVIHAYQASQAAGGGWLLKFFYPNIPFLVTIQEGKDLQKQSVLMRFFRYLILRKANSVTTISRYLEKYIKSYNLGLPIAVIPNGVDTKVFKKVETSIRKELGLQDQRIVITVSRLVQKNGVGDLIKAVGILSKTLPIHLIIVGTGPLESELNQLTKELGLSSQVSFLGSKEYDTLPKYLSAADVFARPSYSEGLGNAFLEAMACQVPIVGTKVGGIPDFLIDEQTGLYCEPGNPESIAQAVSRILTEPSLAESLVLKGLELVEKEFSWDHIAQQFRDIYEKQ